MKNKVLILKKKKYFSYYNAFPDRENIRLNRYLAHTGLTSRRKADNLIKSGVIKVNGKIINNLGYKIFPHDQVKINHQNVLPEKKIYILLNKPKEFICSTKDEKGRKIILDLIKKFSSYRIYPVGRLDRLTTGVLLLTNDGDLTQKLIHPKYMIKKIYHVILNQKLKIIDLKKILKGIYLTEGKAIIDNIFYIKNTIKNELKIELHIGWNRVIHRIFKILGYKIINLDRIFFAGLNKENIKIGQWRILTKKEISFLKNL